MCTPLSFSLLPKVFSPFDTAVFCTIVSCMVTYCAKRKDQAIEGVQAKVLLLEWSIASAYACSSLI